MENNKNYQAVVIGAGQGGVPLAVTWAEHNKKIALIEKNYVGGSCINHGCTPSKTMIASARTAYLARRSADFGIHTGEVVVDMQAVRQRKRDVVESFRKSTQKRILDAGVELIHGNARFLDQHSIEVALADGGKQVIHAEQIFIDTGARPRIPPLGGLSGVPFLDSTSIMELGEVPEELIILGGGYIGVEFAQMFARFGSGVTIIEMADQLLSHEDRDVADEIANILREGGVSVLLNERPLEVRLQDNGQIAVRIIGEETNDEKIVSGSHLLVAAGRLPNIEELNLEAAGIEKDSRGYIAVNEYLETNVENVYAIGDVKGGPAFTHVSYDDYRILRDNLLNGEKTSINDRYIPYTVFTDPELGRIGLNEKQAAGSGKEIRIAKMPMDYVSRAVEMGQPRGFLKLLVEMDTDRILGASVIGIHGGEILAMIEIAMMGDLPYTALREGIFTHPTLAESLNTVFTRFNQG